MADSRWRILVPLVVLLAASTAAITLATGMLAGQERSDVASGAVVRVPVTGVIELGLAPFIARSLDEAEAAGAVAVVLDMDTPGGRIDAAQQIVDAIKNADIPVYAFVNRRAFSAGALIALATNGIYMRTGGVMGAVTPVTGQGEKAPEKIVSAMRSEMRALAEARGLDPRIAEAMVDEDVAVDGVVERGKLLTLTTDEAENLGYAEAVQDWDALVARLDFADAPVREATINWAERLVRFFTHPVVAPMLLSLGFLGLIIELKTPTFGLAGLAGASSLALFFGSHYLVGLAGLEEMILLGAGAVLIAVEVFLIPGFGIAGIAGITAVGASIFLSLLGGFATSADLAQAFGVLSVAGIVVVVAAWALIRHLPRSGRFTRSGLMLGDATRKETGYLSAAIRSELVGAEGVALTDLRPSGTAKFGSERIDVVSDSTWISIGTPVRIVRSDGYRHVVEPIDSVEPVE
jgi:membrane-bound serine protease (ClpP class)